MKLIRLTLIALKKMTDENLAAEHDRLLRQRPIAGSRYASSINHDLRLISSEIELRKTQPATAPASDGEQEQEQQGEGA